MNLLSMKVNENYLARIVLMHANMVELRSRANTRNAQGPQGN